VLKLSQARTPGEELHGARHPETQARCEVKLDDGKRTLEKLLNDYDAGAITLSALFTGIGVAADEIYKQGYKDGLHDAELDDESEEQIEFEADFGEGYTEDDFDHS
jgi:hypothetical protein